MTKQEEQQHIANTLKSLGWKYIDELFRDEIRKFDDSITYNKKDMEEVGKEYVARTEAKKKLEKILRKINSYNQELGNKKVIYK